MMSQVRLDVTHACRGQWASGQTGCPSWTPSSPSLLRPPSLMLSGESCIPGMDANNVESIFEEHTISGSLDSNSTVNNEFGLRERVFNFGSVVADLVSSAGAAAAAAAAGNATGGGVRANLKIINPIKVPCTINFSMKPRGQYPPGEITGHHTPMRGHLGEVSSHLSHCLYSSFNHFELSIIPHLSLQACPSLWSAIRPS